MAELNLETVQGYIIDARVLLLDQVFPFRYGDTSLLAALNLSLLNGKRLRPDLFAYKNHGRVPSYSAVDGQKVPIDPQYRQAFVFGLVGHALMRDADDVQDQRVTMFMDLQEYMLTGQVSRPASRGAGPAVRQQ